LEKDKTNKTITWSKLQEQLYIVQCNLFVRHTDMDTENTDGVVESHSVTIEL